MTRQDKPVRSAAKRALTRLKAWRTRREKYGSSHDKPPAEGEQS